MTDNALKIIKDELARIDEARAFDLIRWQVDLDKYFFENPSQIKPPELCRNNMPKLVIFKSEFEKAFKDRDNLTKALSVAVETMQWAIGGHIDSNAKRFELEKALKTVADILTSGREN